MLVMDSGPREGSFIIGFKSRKHWNERHGAAPFCITTVNRAAFCEVRVSKTFKFLRCRTINKSSHFSQQCVILLGVILLVVILLGVFCWVSFCWVSFCWVSFCRVYSAGCHSAGCHSAGCHSLVIVILLGVILLGVILLGFTLY